MKKKGRIYICILSQPRKEDIRTGAQRYRAKKKEKIKSRIGKVKKLKVMLQKRNKLFHKQKSSKSPTDRHHFLRVKQHIKMKIRQSYDLYIEDILGLNSNSDRKDQNTAIELTDSKKGQSQFSIKKLFSLIKNSRQDSEGIAPLQMPNSENLATQSKDKADIANQQFQKAFSKKKPPYH